MNECCKNSDNIVIEQPAPDKTVAVCQVCKRRHIRLKADPGKFVGLFKPLMQPSSFANLPQWTRHRVIEGVCERCKKALPGDGAVCTMDQMTMLGDRSNAKDCINV